MISITLDQNIRKSLVCVFLIFIYFTSSHSQVFTSKGKDIYDYSGSFYRNFYPIQVKDLSDTINCQFGISQVCINISHARVSDLKISLMSPNGTEVWLTNRNGGEKGRNYTNTCFHKNGFNNFIFDGIPPFSGQYIPDGQIELFNNGQNPNGSWFLIIEDLDEGVQGQLLNFSLHFDHNNNCKENISPSLNDPNSCRCIDNKNECLLLPDLIVLEDLTSKQWIRFKENHPRYPNQIRLGVGMANIGLGPLEVKGTNEWYCDSEITNKDSICPNGNLPHQKVEQRIYKKSHHLLDTFYQKGGNLYFDKTPGHNHYHADDWVDFYLLKRKFWRKNPTKWKVIGKSEKVSYCLFDTNRCIDKIQNCISDKTIYGKENLINYGLGNYFECDSDKQGISVGGIDYYGVMYEGQNINLPNDLKPGTYYIYIVVDPKNHYIESNEKNNTALIKIKIR